MHAASIANIWRLGIKELWSLVRDPMMLVLIVYTFTVSIYVAATVFFFKQKTAYEVSW